MNAKKIILSFAIACFVLTSCKKEEKKAILPVEKAQVAMHISGMTCEIGCAKTIQSKLSKKEGVLDAKVVFADSIATIEFDANKTSEKDLIAFVDGIAGGDLYKASVDNSQASICGKGCMGDCKESCKNANPELADKASCNGNCKGNCKGKSE